MKLDVRIDSNPTHMGFRYLIVCLPGGAEKKIRLSDKEVLMFMKVDKLDKWDLPVFD